MRRLRVLVVLLAGTVLFLLLGAPRPQDPPLANEIVEIAVNLSVEANGISEPDSIPVGDATLIAFLGLSSTANVTMHVAFLAQEGTYSNSIPRLEVGTCVIGVGNNEIVQCVSAGNTIVTQNSTYTVGGPYLAVQFRNLDAATETTLTVLAYPIQ